MTSLQGQIAGVQAQVVELQERLTEQGKSQDALREEVASAKELSQSRERECERLQKQVKQLESQLGRQSSESEEAAAAKHAELEVRMFSIDSSSFMNSRQFVVLISFFY